MITFDLLSVDLSVLNPDHKNLLSKFLTTHNEEYVDKNKTYLVDGQEIQFSQNLIRGVGQKQDDIVFNVISNRPEDSLGKGAFSRVRNIPISIMVAGNAMQIVQTDDKAARITNTQSAQAKRSPEMPYKHEQALKQHSKARNFPHLTMSKPVEVLKDKKPLGIFTKSVTTVNKIPGRELFDAYSEYLNVFGIDTKRYIDDFVLPILEAYKTQIYDVGYVHRDIKSDNILYDYRYNRNPQVIVNFIDVDSSKRYNQNKPDSAYGSPGYLAPELLTVDNVTVQTSRDVFSLGMLLIDVLNFELVPEKIATSRLKDQKGSNYNITASDVVNIHLELIKELGGRYDLVALASKTPDPDDPSAMTDVFKYFSESGPVPQDARDKLLSLIIQMTEMDPRKRPSIDSLVQSFKILSQSFSQQSTKAAATSSSPDTLYGSAGGKMKSGSDSSSGSASPKDQKKDHKTKPTNL